MKNSSIAILSMLAFSSPSFGQSAANFVSKIGADGVYRHSSDEKVSKYSLSTRELCYEDAHGKLRIEPVAAGSREAIVKQASVPEGGKYLVFYPDGQEMNPRARHVLRNRYLMKVKADTDLELVRQRCGIKSLRRLSEGSDLVLCEEESAGKVLGQLSNVLSDPSVISAEPLFARKLYKRLVPSDPFYNTADNPRLDLAYQWYLNNEGVNGGIADIDINLEGALDRATGNGVTVGIVDDGLAIDHDDLIDNATGPHLNLLDGAEDDPTTFDAALNHGTNVAGLIGASFNNGEGISGVAPNSTLSGIRLLGAVTDDADEAQALGFERSVIDIYNGGYGPDDTTLNLEGPGPLTLQAFEQGILNGRPSPVSPSTSLGSIFVWPAGNGGLIGDNSNYDGYANSRFTIAVGSVTDAGVRAPYSERGSNLVVVAPSSGGASDVLTTSYSLGVDQDDNPIRVTEYDPNFTGTSASAAMVSGVVALMLEENPNLTWRDVQDILIRTAVKVDEADGEWITNGAGLEFNENYGAGLVDAQAAVTQALTVNPATALGPEVTQFKTRFFPANAEPFTPESGAVPDNNGESLLVEFDMTEDDGGNAFPNLKVEHVQLSATIVTESRSDLEIVLISPNGTESILQSPDPDHAEQSIFFWSFMTVRNWGEGSGGKWVVRITDTVTGNPAVVNNMSLVVHGAEDADAPVSEIPLLISTRFFTLDQGAPFSYAFQTTGTESIQVGDLPPGLVFNPEARTITGVPSEPGLYTTPVVLVSSTTDNGLFQLNFEVRPTAVALGDAVGLPDNPAFFGGDAPWEFEFEDTTDGDVPEPQSARSAVNLGDNEQSIFGFNDLPGGVLLFDWRTSSEEGGDRLWFNLGGTVPQNWEAFLSGERVWGRTAVLLPNPLNDVRWIYSKNEATSEGEDRGVVDNIELVETDKFFEDVRRAGNIQGLDLNFDSRTLLFPFEFAGGSPSPDGTREILRSSTIGNGQTASVSSVIEGPGRLTFRAFNFGEPEDVLEFLVDGVVVDGRPGAGSGTTPALPLIVDREIAAGQHWIEIRYRKNFRGSDARTILGNVIDGFLLDDVVYTPDNGFEGFVSQYANGLDVSADGDADQDGYSNHYEYAFGGNIVVADVPRYLPRLVEGADRSYIEYGIDTNRTDLDYFPQQSADLTNWVEAELATLDRVENGVEIYRIPVTSATGRRNLFYRVIARSR